MGWLCSLQAEAEMRMLFVACDFALETTQAERITMEEVAKPVASAGVSTLDSHSASLTTSLRALSNRADSLVKYLEALQRGEVRTGHLKACCSLFHWAFFKN